MKIKWPGLLFWFAVLLSALVRCYGLGSVPLSLNADETAIGWNAYSVLRTGRDEYGTFLPLSFRSFDDYKAPLYVYLTSISIAVFGLNQFSVRLPSALAGILTVVSVYYFVRNLIGKKVRATDSYGKLLLFLPGLSALMLAISPWHIHFSRSAYEANLGVFFITLGAALASYGGTRFVLSAIPLGLSLWAYHTPRLFVPAMCLVLALYFRKYLIRHIRASVSFLAIIVLISIPMLFVMLSPEGAVRARGVSSVSDPSILDRSIAWQQQDGGGLMSKLLHNRRLVYGKTIAEGYFSHFDPGFLFFERAQAKYRVPGMGLLYLWELPFLIAGIYALYRLSKAGFFIIALWIALAPLAASPTLWLPHPVRTIVFLPALQILTASGVIAVAHKIWKTFGSKIGAIAISCVAVVAGLFFIGYIHQYFVHMPVDYAEDWQYGRKEAVLLAEEMKDRYDTVVVSTTLDQPQVFFLFYSKYDPETYLLQGGTASGKFDTEENRYGNYVFMRPGTYVTRPGERVLYIGTPQELKPGGNVIAAIDHPDGTPAFVIFD